MSGNAADAPSPLKKAMTIDISTEVESATPSAKTAMTAMRHRQQPGGREPLGEPGGRQPPDDEAHPEQGHGDAGHRLAHAEDVDLELGQPDVEDELRADVEDGGHDHHPEQSAD